MRDASLDHLVGAGEQSRRHVVAERLSGFGVDHQLELARLLDRQIRWLGALEDATGIDAELTIRVREAGSVAHQPAGFWKVALWIDRGDRVARRQAAAAPMRSVMNS